MSQTNQTPAICNKCGNIVSARCGAVRFWNGAARAHAPKYVKRSAFGILHACLCAACEKERNDAARMREYNRRHGFA